MRLVILALALLLSAAAHAATFTVDSTVDSVDALPGDGVCADATGACTLRAAVMETNSLPGADVVHLPTGHLPAHHPRHRRGRVGHRRPRRAR